MSTPVILAALAPLTSALPSPQSIDLIAIGYHPNPVRATAPIDNVTDVVASAPAAPIKPLTNLISSSKKKRDLSPKKRDGEQLFAPLPNPSRVLVVPSPDRYCRWMHFESFPFPTFARTSIRHQSPFPPKRNPRMKVIRQWRPRLPLHPDGYEVCFSSIRMRSLTAEDYVGLLHPC